MANRLIVRLYYRSDIFRTARTAFDLKHPNTGLDHLIYKTDCLKILGRHDVLIVNFEFDVPLFIFDNVSASARLHTSTSICTLSCIVQTEIALAAHCHTKSSVAEHLDSD